MTHVSDPVVWLRNVTLLLALIGPAVVSAQQYPVFQEQLPIASINRERLLSGSAYGRALLARISEHQKQLVLENDALFVDLEREERELTALRKEIPADEFRPLAEAFDAKANKIRRQQREKSTALTAQLEAARFTFFSRTESVIKALMIERGIVYILSEQAILMSTGEGNITPEVMARLDVLFAEGVLSLGDP